MSDGTAQDQRAALRLRPFPGMRYNDAAVHDLGDVTSPPYDVMDRPMIQRLLSENPRNIVRLILPRMVSDPVTGDDPYHRAAKLLRRWRRKEILRTDPGCALYVYEYGDEHYRVCGLVGALDLHDPEDGVVLPHEDVIEGIVADRLAMMTASEANLEPILLVYDGAGDTSDVIERIRTGNPLVDIRASDASTHRLWAITSDIDLAEIRRHLAPHQALIADGHHRYATYLRLRRRHRAIGDGPGPWDRGLVLLIDQSQWPLQLGAIHRSISELRLDDLSAPPGFSISQPVAVDGEARAPQTPCHLIVTDGSRQVEVALVGDRDEAVTDAELLHEHLLPHWAVDEDRLGYHHTVEQTVRNAIQDEGLAVLLHPTTVAEVMAVARAGKIMPRKSTSFGPKPRMGVVMRAFADEE